MPVIAFGWQHLHALDSTDPANTFSVNVADWNASHYVWHGPGVSETPTSVARTSGWHEFRLEVRPTGFRALTGADVNYGPFSLFTVSPSIPRGTYAFSCRMLNPTTGQELFADLNPFTIE